MDREAWRSFICSPDRAGRHLSSIGQGVAGATAEPIDLAVLEDFLRKLDGDDDVTLLTDAVDLLTGGYLDFVRRTLPDLIDIMSNEVLSKQSVVGPGLRGNPVWGRTMLGRMSGALSPVQFISRTSRRSYDLPENRLLRWLVADLGSAVARITRRVTVKGLHPDLLLMLTSCGAAERHHSFSEVAVPGELTAELTVPARRHRRAEYRKAAALAAHRAQFTRNDEDRWWYHVLSLLAVGWLEPLDSEKLFELYVLVLVMDLLAEELAFGDPVEVSLVTAGRRHVAMYSRGEVAVRAFFNQTPSTVTGKPTRYGKIVASHAGVTGAPRRPDIVLAVERDGRRRLVLIEAKETADRDYISDSVYKVFGYLHDFADAYADEEGVRAILVVPEGVTALTEAVGKEPLRIVSANRREDFAAALANAIAWPTT